MTHERTRRLTQTRHLLLAHIAYAFRPGRANFYEKALFVKADVAAAVWPSATALSALRAMLLSALSGSPLSLVARCIMRSVFSGYYEALQSS